jgi:hypothetical protein
MTGSRVGKYRGNEETRRADVLSGLLPSCRSSVRVGGGI